VAQKIDLSDMVMVDGVAHGARQPMPTNFLASKTIPTLSDEGLARHLNRGVRKALEGLEPALRVEAARQAREYWNNPGSGSGGTGQQLVTIDMMRQFGWPEAKLTAEYINHLNDVLRRFGITDMRSVRLFMATVRHESGGGRDTLEIGTDAYFEINGYNRFTRGAGYIQLTHVSTHLAFLEFIGSNFRGQDTATHIANNYPWEAAAYYWTVYGRPGAENNINDWVVEFGDSRGAFLITQYWVNGWGTGFTQEMAEQIRDGVIPWHVQNDRLFVNGINVSRVPLGWDTPITGRVDSYNAAMDIFR